MTRSRGDVVSMDTESNIDYRKYEMRELESPTAV